MIGCGKRLKSRRCGRCDVVYLITPESTEFHKSCTPYGSKNYAQVKKAKKLRNKK